MENVWRQFRAIDVFVKLDSKENNVQVRAKSLKLLLNILLKVECCMDYIERFHSSGLMSIYVNFSYTLCLTFRY